MSVDFYMYINKKCLDSEDVRKYITEFFDLNKKSIKADRDEEFRINKNGILSIYFGKNKKPPMNIYDCQNIFDGEFVFEELLLAEYNKELADIENYVIFIKFGIFIRENIDSDILITSDCHNDICLLKKDDIVWSKNIDLTKWIV